MISKLKTLCAKNRINLLCFKGVSGLYRTNTKYECFQRIQVFQRRSFHNTSALLNNNKSKQDSEHDKSDNKERKTNRNDDNETSQLLTTTAFWMVTSYLVVVGITLLFPTGERSNVISYVTWNEFFNDMLSKGQVERILINPDFDLVTIILREGAIVKDNVVRNRIYHMDIADSDTFETKFRKAESTLGLPEPTPLDYVRNDYTPFKISFVALALILVLLLSKANSNKTPIIQDLFNQMGRAKFTLIEPYIGQGKGVKFSDVAGLQEAKIELKEFVDYLREPERYKRLGAKVPKGALLLGPPGCGKTLLAKAVATECNVPFLSMNGSEFVEMIGGLGAARVRDLFKEAKIRAPCIVYIDEIDAIGKKRSTGEGGGNWDGINSEADQTLNQLLVEMDGIFTKGNIMVLASTNRPDMLDKALLRPGRFDRHIFIDLPTIKERKEIFERHLKNIVLEKDPVFYSWKLSHITTGFNSAQIANVCNEAALHAARLKKCKVGTADLEYALERVQFGSEKKNYTMSNEETKLIAYHESGHAIVGWYMEHADPLLKVTIHPRTNAMTGFTQYAATDKYLLSKEELQTKMCVLLGGRIAEVMMFNKSTTRAQNDLDQATKIAYSMVKEYGMSVNLGLMAFSKHEGKKPYSKTLSSLIDLEVNRLIAETYFMTEKLLDKRFYMMKILAQGLLAKETLNSEDIERLIGPSPYAEAHATRKINFFK